jgi:hypothetical protein
VKNAWHVHGPSPGDAGFPTLGGPIDTWIEPEPNTSPMEALLPFVGAEALKAAVDTRLLSDAASA